MLINNEPDHALDAYFANDEETQGQANMDDDARKQKAHKLADEAARAEAHEAGAFAAEEVRRVYGDDFEGARDPAQRNYDTVWIAAFADCRDFFEIATLALLAAYDAEKHPASVTAPALADTALDTLAPQHATIDPLIRQASRATFIRLAERILEAFPIAREPN